VPRLVKGLCNFSLGATLLTVVHQKKGRPRGTARLWLSVWRPYLGASTMTICRPSDRGEDSTFAFDSSSA
jgi:hypothetical protein